MVESNNLHRAGTAAVMPEPVTDGEPMTRAAAEAWLSGICFRTGPPRRVGIELELVTSPVEGLGARTGAVALTALAGRLSGAVRHGRVTQEPGGQLELSAFPRPGLGSALDAVGDDLAVIRQIAGTAGLRVIGVGVDPVRAPVRILDHPRYVAMECHLDAGGPSGRVMMASTASLQVNVEAGGPGGEHAMRRRWWLLHLVGPALVAAFANSPLREGRLTGWKSTRQAVWSSVDPARTAPVVAGPDEDPREAFTRYALAAPVMVVRRPHGDWRAPAGLSFADWIDGAAARAGLHRPTRDDLAYHLTTLFPPVRPRGYLEVRYLDAQPGRWWRVAAATVWALTQDDPAADQAGAAAGAVRGWWRRAARHGPSDPTLSRAALGCLTAARDALLRLAEPGLAQELELFLETFTARGRCPADDLVDALPDLASSAAPTALEVLP